MWRDGEVEKILASLGLRRRIGFYRRSGWNSIRRSALRGQIERVKVALHQLLKMFIARFGSTCSVANNCVVPASLGDTRFKQLFRGSDKYTFMNHRFTSE